MSLVLLVEDDELVRSITGDMLRELGHEVIESDNALTAVGLFAQREVEVLVTDIGLPGVSGDVFAAQARSAWPGLRVVFITGGSAIADRAHDDFSPVLLRKPYTMEALASALANARQ
jgi:CheY-like chemotaxis protein